MRAVETRLTFMEACEGKRQAEQDGERFKRHLTMSQTSRLVDDARDAMFDAMYGSEVGHGE